MLLFISLQIILIPLESKCETDLSWCKKLFKFAFILIKKMQSFNVFHKLYCMSLQQIFINVLIMVKKSYTPVFSKALKVVFNLF